MSTTLQLTPTEQVSVLEATPDALVVEVVYGPEGSPPPPHLHPSQHERFSVLEGEVTVRLGGDERVARAGEVLEVPPGTRHAFWNAAAAPARLRWETTPAGRTLVCFAALDAAGRAAGGRPGLRAFARLLGEYGDVFRLAVPARPLADAALRLLAALPAPAPRQMPGGPKVSR